MTAAAQAAANQNTDTDDVTDESTEDTAADVQGDDTTEDTGSDDDGDTDWEAKAKELQAKFESQQRINRNLERRTKRDKATIDKLTNATGASVAAEDKSADSKDDKSGQIDVDKIRAEAAAQAKAEAAAEALKERVLDKIEVKAKNFADPADAVTMLMREHKADDFIDDGKIDVDAIQDALTELLEKKPYLGAAQGGKNRFQGSAEGGPKPHKPQRPQSLHEAVNRRYNASQ